MLNIRATSISNVYITIILKSPNGTLPSSPYASPLVVNIPSTVIKGPWETSWYWAIFIEYSGMIMDNMERWYLEVTHGTNKYWSGYEGDWQIMNQNLTRNGLYTAEVSNQNNLFVLVYDTYGVIKAFVNGVLAQHIPAPSSIVGSTFNGYRVQNYGSMTIISHRVEF